MTNDDRRQRAREAALRIFEPMLEQFQRANPKAGYLPLGAFTNALLAFADAEAGRACEWSLTGEDEAEWVQGDIHMAQTKPPFNPPPTPGQLAAWTVEKLELALWGKIGNTWEANQLARVIQCIEAAILDGRKAACEQLHAWLDQQGIARTACCADGSDDAILWLTTRIRAYANGGRTVEGAVAAVNGEL